MITRAVRFGGEALVTFVRNGLIRPVSPGRLPRIAAVLAHAGADLGTGVALAAARWPDRPAILDDDGMVTFAELDRRAAALAAGLRRRYGLGPGRGLAVAWPNHRGFVEAAAAAARLGADVLPLNPHLPVPRLREVLDREEADLMVVSPGIGPVPAPPGVPVLSDLDEVIRAGTGAPAPWPRRRGRLRLLTSGTTGVPKSAPRSLSLLALAEPITSLLARVPLRSGEPLFLAPPLFHGLGILWYGTALLLGCPVVLRRRFDGRDALAAIERHGVTALIAVPVMLRRLLAARAELRAEGRPGGRGSPLRVVVSGGAALPPELADRFTAAFGDVLYNFYGSTEAGIATVATPADLREAPGTVGRPLAGTTVRIAGPTGAGQPPGGVGRVLVGGALTIAAAPGAPEPTGDLGHLDPAGRLFIHGRADNMIVSGGENVYPEEVENLLAGHPGVADVAVLGVPDEEFGQRLAAYVVPAAGARLTADVLAGYVRTHLARHKVPRSFEFVAAIPRTQTGKVDQVALTANAPAARPTR